MAARMNAKHRIDSALRSDRWRDSKSPWILGISASHNGALCLLHGDELVVAIQEERLIREKRVRLHGALGSLALRYCLDFAGIGIDDLDLAVFCPQRSAKLAWDDPMSNPDLRALAGSVPILTISHHKGHAIGAFATSGFADAAVLVVDGMGSPYEDLDVDERATVVGEPTSGNETISLFAARGVEIKALEKHLVPGGRWLHRDGKGMPRFASLGGIFSAAAAQMFGDAMEAGKVMGLAPYGSPKIPEDAFFTIVDGEFIYSTKVVEQFQHDDRFPARRDEYQDLSASAQVALERALLYLARRAMEKSGSRRLCYAGGVALNSVANERIIREVGFDEVFIMPAAEDSGVAIGAAYYGLWQLTQQNRCRRLMHDAVGRSYSSTQIDDAIRRAPALGTIVRENVIERTVDLLCDGKIVGWFHGRSELGPRSLGQRSILCDPRRPDAKDLLNARVKHRESFRPFAPVIPLEHAKDWFDFDGSPAESPFMLRVCKFKEDRAHRVPAVVHVDGTGRIQTLTREANGPLYELVCAFHARTGVPILLNTSFNVAGEPIVESPSDALWCLAYTGVDCCVFEDRIVSKKQGYRSILELYPWVTADACALKFPIRDGALRLETMADDATHLPFRTPVGRATGWERYREDFEIAGKFSYARFSTQSEWGPTVQIIDLDALDVVSHCDGKRTGWQILEALKASQSGAPPTETSLVHRLGALRRASILGFRDNPMSG